MSNSRYIENSFETGQRAFVLSRNSGATSKTLIGWTKYGKIWSCNKLGWTSMSRTISHEISRKKMCVFYKVQNIEKDIIKKNETKKYKSNYCFSFHQKAYFLSHLYIVIFPKFRQFKHTRCWASTWKREKLSNIFFSFKNSIVILLFQSGSKTSTTQETRHPQKHAFPSFHSVFSKMAGDSVFVETSMVSFMLISHWILLYYANIIYL